MKMKYPIALTPYLNTRSFYYHQVPDDFELVAMTPRESVQAIADGRAIAGIVPVAGLKRIEDYIDYPGDFGIASEGPVNSVLFFSGRPFAEFTRNCNISLTSESLTSIQLLSLLFVYQLGQNNLPGVSADGAHCDGQLLIGDKALSRYYQGEDKYVTDLSEKWTQYHHCPFVFARWVIRRDAPVELRAQLQNWLERFVNNEIFLKLMTAAHEAVNFGMTTRMVFEYLQGIKTHIGQHERYGQALYFDELERYRPAFIPCYPQYGEKSFARL